MRNLLPIVIFILVIMVAGRPRRWLVPGGSLALQVEQIHRVDSLYKKRNYAAAFDIYQRYTSDALIRSDDAAQFKTAFAAYKTGKHDTSARIFDYLYNRK